MTEIAPSSVLGNVINVATETPVVVENLNTGSLEIKNEASPTSKVNLIVAEKLAGKMPAVEPVEMIKIEPGCVEIEVSTTPSESNMIVPDNAVDNVDTAVPEPNNIVKVFNKLPFKPNITSTPLIKMSGECLIKPRNKLLTSNILSADEIAKEVLERAERKRPHQLPEGGDLIFQKQITKRLAEKIVKEETLNPHISIEMLTPPPPPKLPELDRGLPDMDAQMLLQILQEGAESQYPEPSPNSKIPGFPHKLSKFKKPEVDRTIEKEIALKQLMEVSQKDKKRKTSENNNNSPKSEQKPKKRLKNEVQKLLQDEGAINMLYDMEKGQEAKATNLPSKRRMKKAFMRKAQEVSQAILDGSTLNKGLRLRHPVETKIKKEPEESPEGKIKKEIFQEDKIPNNNESIKTSFVAPSPTPGASKIIRRHSSSSSYSGNNSPTRRISVDDVKSDSEIKKNVMENGVTHDKDTNKSIKSPTKASPSNSLSPTKSINNKSKPSKLVKKIVKKSLDNSTSKAVKSVSLNGTKGKKSKTVKSKNAEVKGKNVSVGESSSDVKPIENAQTEQECNIKQLIQPEKVENDSTHSENEPPSNKSTLEPPDENEFKEKLQSQFTSKLKKMMVRQGILSKGDSPKKSNLSSNSQNVIPKPGVMDKQLLSDNKTIAYEAIWQMLQDDWNTGDDPDDPPMPFEGPSYTENSSVSFISDLDSPKPLRLITKNEIAPLPASEPELDVIPENKNEVPFSHHLGTNSFMYKELMIRKIGPLVHVNIAPVSTHLPQAFNVQVLKELTSVLESCGSDHRCRCLLLTSSGSLFSSGVDLPFLLGSDPSARLSAAKATAQAVKEFALKLGMFSKMVVAGVSGPCVGLGVAMLPLCDVVFSSPRSVFLAPYSSLGYIPEAAASLTLPIVVGHRMASSMLIGGRKLTADEALKCGLISELLPEENFACRVLESAFLIATQSAQSMESTKALMMHPIRSRLSTVLTMESALLQQHWLTHDCQLRIKDKGEKLLNE